MRVRIHALFSCCCHIGAILFGHIGDCKGRHYALLGSLLSISLSTAAMASFPFNSSQQDPHMNTAMMIGWAAPRFIQGMEWVDSMMASLAENTIVTICLVTTTPHRSWRGWTMGRFNPDINGGL